MICRRLLLVACVATLAGNVLAADSYYAVRLSALELSGGSIPAASQNTYMGGDYRRWMNVNNFLRPYAVGNAGEEVYIEQDEHGPFPGMGSIPATPAGPAESLMIFIRSTSDELPSGRIFLPNAEASGFVPLQFKVKAPSPDSKDAQNRFETAMRSHYERLMWLNLPGAAWFRHQANRSGSFSNDPRAMGWNDSMGGSQLEQNWSVFTGGRALSENMQLDRELRFFNDGEAVVPLSSLTGITTAAVDWKKLTAGMEPKKDPLAAFVPADQHAVFFPNFQAMTALVDEVKGRGIPILRMAENRAEDSGTQVRYERQLCLRLDEVSRALGEALVTSIAFTGSDPYLRTGSDVAILFETQNPKALEAGISTSHLAAQAACKEAKPVAGTVQDTPYSGVVSDDRSICSYVASTGQTVVLTNSLAQLERILATGKGQIPAMASLDEFTFFRDRYRLDAPGQHALLMVTDAALRRWCGPKWRIAEARRMRAAAILAELQARNLDALAAGKAVPGPLASEASLSELGELRLTESGVVSSKYGSLGFLTPIVEMPMDNVTKREAQAYEQFRSSYQVQWRYFFDPLGICFTVAPDRIGADLTIRPLIAATTYQDMIRAAGNVSLGPRAGDPHPESLLHWVMGFDPQSQELRRQWNLSPGSLIPQVSPLDCLGSWLTAYVDEDPFWEQLADAAKEPKFRVEEYLWKNIASVPLAVEADIRDSAKAALFMISLRAMAETTAPGMARWENVEYEGQTYVRVRVGMGQEVSVYYVLAPNRFIMSLHEEVLRRALARANAPAASAKSEAPVWQGGSVNVRASQTAASIVPLLYGEQVDALLEYRAWCNIPILNEWRRRYGCQAPIDFHRRFWQTSLVCPGGGDYVWNEEFQTYESTVYGYPGARRSHLAPQLFPDIASADFGLTFEEDGLRAQVQLTRQAK